MEFVKRENEIFKTLKKLTDEKLDFVVVGGYAVSGLARHRFSVDCDMVIPKKELEKFEKILSKEGFKTHVRKTGFDETYGGEFISHKKTVGELPVTIDLLAGSLVCRATEASWSFEYIQENSIQTAITGTEMSVSCRIPQRELLIAFKMHSARRTDIRDIIMLKEGSNQTKLVDHLKRGNMQALETQLARILDALDDEKLVNSLKGVFTLSANVKKQIAETRTDVQNILKKIRQPKQRGTSPRAK